MIEILKDYLALIIGVLCAVLWQGRLQQRVKNLEEENYIPSGFCLSHRTACQQFQAQGFSHGQKEFDDIKRLITQVKRCSEEQHNMIMKHLLENK